MATDGARRLNRSSPSCLNSGAQRTDFFHGLIAPVMLSSASPGQHHQYKHRPASLVRPFDSADRRVDLELGWFVGIDWDSQKHQACVIDAAGKVSANASSSTAVRG